jgi:hypothetical protein
MITAIFNVVPMWVLVHPGPFNQAKGETLGTAVEGAGLAKATYDTLGI